MACPSLTRQNVFFSSPPKASRGGVSCKLAGKAMDAGAKPRARRMRRGTPAVTRRTESSMRLRQRKQRYTKAFALMARDLDVIRRYAEIGPAEEAALISSAAPIVIIEARGSLHLPEDVAPGLATLGFMLPSTPLHHLMFRRLDRPVVMTSGNRSDEPQIIDDEAARTELAGIADFLLTHDRGIAVRLSFRSALTRSTSVIRSASASGTGGSSRAKRSGWQWLACGMLVSFAT